MIKVLQMIKKIFLFIFKEICSFFIKSILALFLLILILSAVLSYFSKATPAKVEDGSYVLIQAATPLTEHVPVPNIFALKENPITFFELLYSLDNVRQDERIKGVLLDVNYLSWDKAQVEEIGEKIKKLQAEGKKVISFFDEVDRTNYLMASYAKEIIMPPVHSASSSITAYSYEELYWKSLFDRFGVKVNVIPIGDYKSYMENYSHGEMSPEFRANTKHMLDASYEYTVELIANNRNLNKETLNSVIESGELMGSSFPKLLEHTLVTQGKYPSELMEEIGDENIISVENYYQQIKPKHQTQQYIALLTLEGDIEDESLFLSEVDTIRKDDNVAAVVLRINSPGGSALASDIMYNAVKRLREKVPVYVSIGGVAASGGYYVASAGEKIFASSLSVTGSIGVVSMIPNFSELQKKASVKSEEIMRGKYADLYSSSKPLSRENFERIRESNFNVYQDFLDVVSANRKIDKDYLDKNIAQGRVFLGLESKKIQLIDEIGSLEATIYALEKDKHLAALPIVEISENNVLDSYLSEYRRYLKWMPISLRKNPSKDTLWNKPVMYFPYEIQ